MSNSLIKFSHARKNPPPAPPPVTSCSKGFGLHAQAQFTRSKALITRHEHLLGSNYRVDSERFKDVLTLTCTGMHALYGRWKSPLGW